MARMRFCLSSSMIGEPQSLQVQSSSAPSGFCALKGWRLSFLAWSTARSPCRKKTTCVVGCPVTALHTEQWQVWLSIGSWSAWV